MPEAAVADVRTQHDFTERPPDAMPATDASQQVGVEAARRLSAAVAARMAPSKEDEKLFVEFYRDPLDEKEYVRIKIPGDKLFQPVFPADDHYKSRFARQWNEYVNDRSQLEGQTLLNECGWINEGMREHLNYYGVKTIEHLAGMSDSNMQALGPNMRQVRDKARNEVAARQKAAEYDNVRAEMDALRAEVSQKADALDVIKELQAEIAELKKRRNGAK